MARLEGLMTPLNTHMIDLTQGREEQLIPSVILMNSNDREIRCQLEMFFSQAGLRLRLTTVLAHHSTRETTAQLLELLEPPRSLSHLIELVEDQ